MSDQKRISDFYKNQKGKETLTQKLGLTPKNYNPELDLTDEQCQASARELRARNREQINNVITESLIEDAAAMEIVEQKSDNEDDNVDNDTNNDDGDDENTEDEADNTVVTQSDDPDSPTSKLASAMGRTKNKTPRRSQSSPPLVQKRISFETPHIYEQ